MRNIKVLFLAKQTLSSISALQYMIEQNVEISYAVLRKEDFKLVKICNENKIRVGSEEELIELARRGAVEADFLISFYWKRAKKITLSIADKGSINFHPGPLPEARGSGYHVAILYNWGYWGVTAHFMDEEFDTGDVIECRKFPVPDDAVNKDLVEKTHQQLFLLFRDILLKMMTGETLVSKRQGEGTYYSMDELEDTKQVRDSESDEEINRKIRAFWNPPYSGAQILVNGKKYTIINDVILRWIADRIERE